MSTTVTRVFRPRRGLAATMKGTKSSTVLSKGEFFVEYQGSEEGKCAIKIKMGDGTSTYNNLPYALGDSAVDTVTFGNNSASTTDAALSSVVSGATLATIVSGLKQAIAVSGKKINNVVNIFDSTVSLSKNGWQGSSAPWSQTVTLNGVTSTGKYQLFSNCTTNDTNARNAYNKAFGIITQGSATTSDNSITFNVWKKPAVDVSVRVVSLVGTYVGGTTN